MTIIASRPYTPLPRDQVCPTTRVPGGTFRRSRSPSFRNQVLVLRPHSVSLPSGPTRGTRDLASTVCTGWPPSPTFLLTSAYRLVSNPNRRPLEPRTCPCNKDTQQNARWLDGCDHLTLSKLPPSKLCETTGRRNECLPL